MNGRINRSYFQQGKIRIWMNALSSQHRKHSYIRTEQGIMKAFPLVLHSRTKLILKNSGTTQKEDSACILISSQDPKEELCADNLKRLMSEQKINFIQLCKDNDLSDARKIPLIYKAHWLQYVKD